MPYAPFFHNVDAPDHGRAFRVTAAAGLNCTVAPGRYRVNQTVYNFTTPTNLVVAALSTNYVHLTSAGAIATNAVGYPANSIPLARVVTGAASITLPIVDDRCFFAVET